MTRPRRRGVQSGNESIARFVEIIFGNYFSRNENLFTFQKIRLVKQSVKRGQKLLL